MEQEEINGATKNTMT
jgi:uncharacterized coiled-coil protein SlyX